MRVHFIGCGGASMSRLMEITAAMGHEASGSDSAQGGHDANNVEGANLVVYTAAIAEDNVELVEAKKRLIPTIERAQYLAAIADGFERVIAVAGTHGKSTTTGMLASVFAARSPTVHLGGTLRNPPAFERDEIFITEACEYRRSLLHLRPSIGVILNAELDHTDCYKTLDDVLGVFGEFAANSGLVIYNGDDEGLRRIAPQNSYSFGVGEHNDFLAVAMCKDRRGRYSFNLMHRGVNCGRLSAGQAGKHNAYNALAAASTAMCMGVPFGEIADGLTTFCGVGRRLEFLGTKNGARVYTDYAHHPTEIRATLSALCESRVIVAFEPHLYSRTRDLFSEFATCFAAADIVIFLPVYGARETGGEVSSRDLAAAVPNSIYCESYAALNEYLAGIAASGDAVVFMGAGTINLAAVDFTADTSRRAESII